MSEAVDDGARITVPAKPEFLHVVRTVIGSIAARHDLTIDAIEDLRIAVDEACAQLLVARGSTVSVRMIAREDGIEAVCSTDAEVAVWPPEGIEQTLASQVLRGLSDTLSWERTDGEPTVRIGKRAVGASGA